MFAKVNETPSFVREAPVDHFTEPGVVGEPDVFQHAYRHEGVIAAADVPVIVLHKLNGIAETFRLGLLPGIGHLL